MSALSSVLVGSLCWMFWGEGLVLLETRLCPAAGAEPLGTGEAGGDAPHHWLPWALPSPSGLSHFPCMATWMPAQT